MSEIKIKSIAKILHETILELSEEEANKLIDKRDNEQFCCEEKALFIVRNSDGTITAIDNTSGDCFCEDFKIKDDAIIWLLGLKNAYLLQTAEGTDWWW